MPRLPNRSSSLITSMSPATPAAQPDGHPERRSGRGGVGHRDEVEGQETAQHVQQQVSDFEQDQPAPDIAVPQGADRLPEAGVLPNPERAPHGQPD